MTAKFITVNQATAFEVPEMSVTGAIVLLAIPVTIMIVNYIMSRN